jgi:hypothetical protein
MLLLLAITNMAQYTLWNIVYWVFICWYFPFKLLNKLLVFDSQNIFTVFLPIAILHYTICGRISWPKTKLHVFDIQNMLALLSQTIMAQITLCTNVFEIGKYGFITLISLSIQHVFDNQNMFTLLIPIAMLHHTLYCRFSFSKQRSMFWTFKTCLHC